MTGKRVLLLKPNSYAGFLGVVEDLEITADGYYYRVKLDNGTSCYADYTELEEINE